MADDVLFRFRQRLLSLAEELGNVRAACRAMGVPPSTYHHCKAMVEHSGVDHPGELVGFDCFTWVV